MICDLYDQPVQLSIGTYIPIHRDTTLWATEKKIPLEKIANAKVVFLQVGLAEYQIINEVWERRLLSVIEFVKRNSNAQVVVGGPVPILNEMDYNEFMFRKANRIRATLSGHPRTIFMDTGLKMKETKFDQIIHRAWRVPGKTEQLSPEGAQAFIIIVANKLATLRLK